MVARARWHVRPLLLWPAAIAFLSIDLGFLAANLTKFSDGAWFPIAVGLLVFTLMFLDALIVYQKQAGR